MTVTHGGDPRRMREIAGQLKMSGESANSCMHQSQTSRQVLEGSWTGGDAEYLLAEAQVAEGHLSSAADRLIAFAGQLIDQAQQQEAASEAGSGSSGGPPPGALADNNDARDNHWWNLRKKDPADYETDGDPGADVEMPEGIDPDSQLARDLMATPQGRETLEWLRKNDIEVKYDPNRTGAFYSPGDNSITFGVEDTSVPEDERVYNDSPGTLIHEANHAQWDAEDQGLDIDHGDREEYVTSQIDEEIEGQSESWAWNEQARAEGIDVPMGADEQAYRDAVDEARADGATPAEAEAAGREEVRLMFKGDHPDTNYTQSTDGQNYYDRHREDWDDRHDWWPLW